jgi:hypothetical protein
MRHEPRKGSLFRVAGPALGVVSALAVGCAATEGEGGARNAATAKDSGNAPAEAGPQGGAPGTGGAATTGGSDPVGAGGAPREIPPYPPVPLGKCPEGLPGPARHPVRRGLLRASALPRPGNHP